VNDIVVYGVGGTSRDLLECLEAINEDRRQWNILGFVDDNAALAGTAVFEYPVLGTAAILTQPIYRQCRIAIGVANDRDLLVRRRIRQALDAMRFMSVDRLPVIIHPTAAVSRRSRLGAGSVMFSGSFCSGNCSVGMHTLVLQGAVISHDSRLGDYVTLCADVAMGGGVQIEDGAFVGLGAVVYPNVRIGQASRVGLGSVVLRDVADGDTVSGSPARRHERPGPELDSVFHSQIAGV
jgi:sugar O-acyltransferase (sialic acid O-acetyltransferase NeuD family)